MTNKVHLRTPVKIYTEGWVDTELVITDDSLIIGKQKISLGEIEDLEDIDVNGVSCTPVKIYTEGWVDTELVITDDSLIIGKQKISLGEIEDLEDIDVNGVSCI